MHPAKPIVQPKFWQYKLPVCWVILTGSGIMAMLYCVCLAKGERAYKAGAYQ
jgi:hypothetical protein